MENLNPNREPSEKLPVTPARSDWQLHPETQLLSWKLQLTQSAMCHQYARMEYERTICVMRRGELMEEMALYHADYHDARAQLARFQPERLAELEFELRCQKQLVFGKYDA